MPSTHTNRPVFGVDFGMSTSSLAILLPDGSTQLVTDSGLRPGAQHAVPTAVCLDDSGEKLLVGSVAVNARNRRPEAYLDNFKLRVEVGARRVWLADRPFEVVDLVAAVLAFLRERAREIDPREPAATVLTVPAGWAQGRAQMMINAAIKAGFPADSLYPFDEPIAAANYARALKTVADGDTVLVYDLGGGTFDTAVVASASGPQRGVWISAAEQVGGHQFDLLLREELGRRFPDQVGAILKGEATDADRWRRMHLLETCESLKIRLSDSERVYEPLTELAQPVYAEISRAEFEDLIRGPIEQTMNSCLQMMRRIGLTWDQVHAVVPVGGSSRIPMVQRMLEDRAYGRVQATPERDTAVVRGAALLARERADHVLEAQGPGAQELTPPRPWEVAAARGQPEVVGARSFTPFRREWLAWIWVTLIPSVAAAVALAWSHWRWLGAVVICTLAALAVSGAIWLTVQKERAVRAVVLMATATGLMAAILIVAGIELGYRTIAEHHPGGPVAWWALGAGLSALIAAIVQAFAGVSANDDSLNRGPAEEDARLVEQISGRDWFGTTETPPDFMGRLFKLPALRGCELSTSAAAGGFNYALAAGSRVLLVSMLTSTEDRPELDAAMATWRSRLTDSVLVKTILVVPGYELPSLNASEQFALTAPLTTTQAFVDTVGHWLDRDNRILVPVMRGLLGGSVQQTRLASPA